MSNVAITELKSRAIEAIASAEKYRDLAVHQAALREFYHALATTYERAAREMNMMLDKVERVSRPEFELLKAGSHNRVVSCANAIREHRGYR